MKKDFNFNERPSGYDRTKNGPKVMKDVINEYFCGGQPLAVAFRNRMMHPNTELGVDVKFLTREPGRMNVGDSMGGLITCDQEGHFTFVENAAERKETVRRYPHMYVGKRINVIRRNDGRLHTTFNKPHYDKGETFGLFCREAAEELMAVAGLVEEEEAEV